MTMSQQQNEESVTNTPTPGSSQVAIMIRCQRVHFYTG